MKDPENELKNDQELTKEMGKELEIDNLPNRITIFRVFLIPIIIGCLFLQKVSWEWFVPYQTTLGWIAAWTFVVASITDFIDGHIARKRNIVTIFGSFLDPIADKFLVVSALIMLQALDRVHVLIVTILVLREIYMTSLRLLASTEGIQVPVSKLGKWKTATQMIGMPMLMGNQEFAHIPFPLLGTLFIYAASVLSLYSAIVYSLGLIKKIKQARLHRIKKKKFGKKFGSKKNKHPSPPNVANPTGPTKPSSSEGVL